MSHWGTSVGADEGVRPRRTEYKPGREEFRIWGPYPPWAPQQGGRFWDALTPTVALGAHCAGPIRALLIPPVLSAPRWSVALGNVAASGDRTWKY